jgi:hypothetical protein
MRRTAMKRLCLAVLLIPAVVLLGCAAPASDTGETPAAGSESKDNETVFEDDFESGKTDDWSGPSDEGGADEETGEAGEAGETAGDEDDGASHSG